MIIDKKCIQTNIYKTAISFAKRAEACLTKKPVEAIQLLTFAKRYALESGQSLPEEYQTVYNAALEGGAKQRLQEAKNGLLNDKPGEVLRYLNLALGYASEVKVRLPDEDLEEIVNYLGEKDMFPHCAQSLMQYRIKLGLED